MLHHFTRTTSILLIIVPLTRILIALEAIEGGRVIEKDLIIDELPRR